MAISSQVFLKFIRGEWFQKRGRFDDVEPQEDIIGSEFIHLHWEDILAMVNTQGKEIVGVNVDADGISFGYKGD